MALIEQTTGGTRVAVNNNVNEDTQATAYLASALDILLSEATRSLDESVANTAKTIQQEITKQGGMLQVLQEKGVAGAQEMINVAYEATKMDPNLASVYSEYVVPTAEVYKSNPTDEELKEQIHKELKEEDQLNKEKQRIQANTEDEMFVSPVDGKVYYKVKTPDGLQMVPEEKYPEVIGELVQSQWQQEVLSGNEGEDVLDVNSLETK